MARKILLLAKVFKNNIGVHFTCKEHAGLGNSAWYEMDVPFIFRMNLSMYKDRLEDLFKAGNIGQNLRLAMRDRDTLIVDYDEVPEGYVYKLAPRGYDLVERICNT